MKKILIILLLIINSLAYSQNCPATFICGSTNNTPNGFGVQELNGGNAGCLFVEHNSTWFTVTILTSGTLGFTVNPNVNSNDFDIGVWGPNSPCPPTNNPIRCTYAIQGGTGNTGLGNSAADNSEGVFGDQWVSMINVIAGQTYLILVDNFTTNSGFNISFTGTATLNCLTLPIELVDFQLSNEDYNININWTTSSEVNNSHFIIQKNITNPINIGRIEGNGNSNSMVNYLMVDKYPEIGLNYYRLIQYDFNGDSTAYDWKSIYVDQTDICCKKYYDLSGRKVDFSNVVSGIYIGITENNKVIKVRK